MNSTPRPGGVRGGLPAWGRLAVPGAVLAGLLYAGLVAVPGPHDNDWPLHMWLAFHASPHDLAPLAIGHQGPGLFLVARGLGALFGSPLVAIKVANAVCIAAVGWILYGVGARLEGRNAGWGAMLLFLASPAALMTGQAEFGDPLALLPYTLGLAVWLRGGSRLGAGVLLGLGGFFRTHMQLFAVITGGVVLLDAWIAHPELPRRRRLREASALVLGLVLGSAPAAAVNLVVHGRVQSAVMTSFVGQVVHGVDDFDFYRTYALHPVSGIEPAALLRLVGQRFRDNLGGWLLPAVLAAVAVGARRRLAPRSFRTVLATCLLALAYFAAFVSLAWYMSLRLVLPLAALVSIAGGVLAGRLAAARFRTAAALVVLFLAGRLADASPYLRGETADTENRWRQSGALTRVLRDRGLGDPREAFVFDWNRFPVDDPRLLPFYNFGFWDLLNEDFRRERPLPTPFLDAGDLEGFTAFLRDHGVRFIVLTRTENRFPALRPVLDGDAGLPGFHEIAELEEDVVYEADP